RAILDNLSELLNIAKAGTVESRKVLLSYFGKLKSVEEKPRAGLVSEADKESESLLKSHFSKNTPDFDFLGEEEGLSEARAGKKSRGRWICDPLDGTTNYVHGLPFFCTSIGLELDGELVLGVIDVPCLDQQFTAIRGSGAFLNGEKIKTSSRTRLEECLLVTGFSYRPEDLEAQVNTFIPILKQARGIRRLGAAALDLCYVASGVFDGFWEQHLNPWDLAAGAVIVSEAGGIVTDFSGKQIQPLGTEIVAASKGIHAQLLGQING
ncbi:MAG: inositol monophosphatase, partial [Bdellovibrionales bacterium]|nr:inositol monophosphatase [Bdellovibrionales bacterium]